MILQAAQSEITRLKEQNAHLSGLLESERKNALKARDGLLKRVSSMLEEFIDDRDKDLRDTISGLQESNTQASENMESLTKKHDLHMSEIGTRNRVWSSSLEKLASEGGQAKLAASEVYRFFVILLFLQIHQYFRSCKMPVLQYKKAFSKFAALQHLP